jgi:hypothetical protein
MAAFIPTVLLHPVLILQGRVLRGQAGDALALAAVRDRLEEQLLAALQTFSY